MFRPADSTPVPDTLFRLSGGCGEPTLRPGLNFATQDSLALHSHPALEAAGLPTGLPALDTRLATFLQLPVATTFTSGTEAIRQTLLSILRSGDDVIVDSAAHPAVVDCVHQSRAQLYRSPAASFDGVERRLTRLARQPHRGRLVIVTPALSPHSARITDVAELCSLARHHGARLIVDISQDIGAMGQMGGGVMEIQACLSRADVVLGSFRPTFATAGGFAAFRNPAHRAALSQAGATLTAETTTRLHAALDLIDSPEGRRRRRTLHGAALRLRNHLLSDGIKIMGQPAPFVPILLPPDTALPRTALLESAGHRVQLLQAPKVPLHAPRWRIQLSAAHGLADIDDLADLIRDVARSFNRPATTSRVPA